MNTLLKPFYAVVPLSLEELFAEELTKLGIEKFRLEKGGCWFGAEMSQMMQVNLWTRYASRILLKVTEGPYRTEEDIYKLAKSFRWEQYFTPENTFKIELSSRRSPLKSVAFAALRVKDAVCDYFRETDGQRPDVEKHDPDIRIYVHLTDKNCIIYLDTSGESLFKRGWREAKGEAPLKENLAAGLAKNPLKYEDLLPDAVCEAILAGKARVRVLPTHESWFGVTYHEDKPMVMESIRALKARGVYRERLWG